MCWYFRCFQWIWLHLQYLTFLYSQLSIIDLSIIDSKHLQYLTFLYSPLSIIDFFVHYRLKRLWKLRSKYCYFVFRPGSCLHGCLKTKDPLFGCQNCGRTLYFQLLIFQIKTNRIYGQSTVILFFVLGPIYTVTWKQKTLCSRQPLCVENNTIFPQILENNTIFTQMLGNKRPFVRMPKLLPYRPFPTTNIASMEFTTIYWILDQILANFLLSGK